MKTLISFWGLFLIAQSGLAIPFEQVWPIIQDNCQVCHSVDGPVDFLPFDSRETIAGKESAMLRALEDQRMPMGNEGFSETADGQLLMEWLREQVEGGEAPDPMLALLAKDPRTVTFAEVEPLLATNCQGCHRLGGVMERRPLQSLSDLIQRRNKAWKKLDRQQMPPNNPEFLFTIEGRILLGWLAYGADVNGDRQGDDDGGFDDD